MSSCVGACMAAGRATLSRGGGDGRMDPGFREDKTPAIQCAAQAHGNERQVGQGFQEGACLLNTPTLNTSTYI